MPLDQSSLRLSTSVSPAALSALHGRADLRRALAAYGAFMVVEIACWLAIVMWAYGLGGTGLAGIAAVVQLVPSAVVAPVLAGALGRVGRTAALPLAHGAFALATLLAAIALAVEAPAWVVLAASTAVTTSVSLVRPLHFATLPRLAQSADELVSANALSGAVEQLACFAGPVLAGVLVTASGAHAVLLVACATAAIATSGCWRLEVVAPAAPIEEPAGLRATVRELRAVARDRGTLALLVVVTTSFVVVGALDVLAVALSDVVLGRGDRGAGFVIGATGVGGLVGAAVASVVAGRRYLMPAIVVAGVAQGVTLVLVAGAPAITSVLLLVALCGLADAVLGVCGRTLLQRATDERGLSRTFALQESAAVVGQAIGAGLAPLLVELLSPAGAFLPLGIVVVGATASSALFVRRLDARAVFCPRETARLRSVAFFARLPVYELERLARRARWVDVPAGTEVIHQGDAGLDFFVVDEGEYDVTIDGRRLDGRLGPGESFGEIAPLDAVPRTATVTAAVPGRLLVVGSRDFLAAVTGSEDGYVVARQVVAARRNRREALVTIDRVPASASLGASPRPSEAGT